MNTQELIKAHIRAHVEKRGMTLADASREMGKYSGYIRECLNPRKNIGWPRMQTLHPHFKFPKWLLVAAQADHEERKAEKYERISAKLSRDDEGVYPWPLTVAELKANPPVYNWSVM